MKSKPSLISIPRFFLVILVILILISPGAFGASRSLKNTISSDEQIVSKISKQLEIPAGSDYYLKFDSQNLTLKEKIIQPYSQGLSDTIINAIAKSPQWIQQALTRQFRNLSNSESYADVLLNSSKQFADEIAFCIACCPGGKVPSPLLLKENAETLYEHDSWIQYADIIDYDDAAGNYYSTIRYMVLENGSEQVIELPSEIYYWYIVHPKITQEDVNATYGPLWRDYLFDHNDLGYPLLKEKLASIQYLWDSTSYYQPGGRLWSTCIKEHPTAIEAVSYWIGKTVPYPAFGDRPGQPCIIAHEHNGWCGELRQLAIAAQRAALIPTIGASNVGEDHVWREFYERGWHENDNWWSDTGGAVDMPDVYAYGWGKNMSAIYQSRGDDTIMDDTTRYIHPQDRITVRFKVRDSFLQPVDGARVTVLVKGPKDITWYKDYFWEKIQGFWDRLPEVLKGKILTSIFERFKERYDQIPDGINGVTVTTWNYTDVDGQCSFQLGKNREYVFLIQQGNLRKPWQLARHNTLRSLTTHTDKEFTILLPSFSQKPQRITKQDMPAGDCQFHLSVSSKGYQLQKNFLTGGIGSQDVPGRIECFFVDAKNFEQYTSGKRFACYNYVDAQQIILNVSTPQQDWYIIFRNQGRSTNMLVTFTLQVNLSSDSSHVQIVTPATSLFDVPTVTKGETVVISGVATGEVFLTIGCGSYTATPVNGVWSYAWNTSGAACGRLYNVGATCDDAYDATTIRVIDGFPPLLVISEPVSGAIIEKGIVTIAGSSYDNDEVDHVEVRVDEGAWMLANGTTNWMISWDLTNSSVGDHTVAAKAVDANGLVSVQTITVVVNETGHTWGPQINSMVHLPGNATNTSNMIIYANVTSSSPFALKSILLYCDNGTDTVSYEMYRYGDFPVQSRHEEDPRLNESNMPLYGAELGQFSTGQTMTYWVVAVDTALNSKQSDIGSFTIQ